MNSLPGNTYPDRHVFRAASRAMFAKEWHEQRWRFALGAFVLTGMLAALLRAQVIPYSESALLVYWIVGVLMTIFLAMGPVAGEKADGTWTFLLAQPISRGQVLIAKWRVVLLQLVGIMAIATVAGIIAMWTRGFAGAGSLVLALQASQGSFAERLLAWAVQHPGIWMLLVAACATIALACWLTPLFFILVRARNEFTAALGGILLTIVLHAWLMVGLAVPTYRGLPEWVRDAGAWLGMINPLMLLVAAFKADAQPRLALLAGLQIALWIALPLWIVHHYAARPAKR